MHLSLGLLKGRPVYRKGHQPSSSTSKHEINNFFLLLWVIFALGSGSTTLVFAKQTLGFFLYFLQYYCFPLVYLCLKILNKLIFTWFYRSECKLRHTSICLWSV
jgi:hypothetical protein